MSVAEAPVAGVVDNKRHHPEDFVHFRALLKARREGFRWSQERLAAECGMDHSLVSRLESGQRAPTREAIAKLIAGLDVPLATADLFYLAAGYLPPAVLGPHKHDHTVIRLWRYLRDDGIARDFVAQTVDAVLLLATDGRSAEY